MKLNDLLAEYLKSEGNELLVIKKKIKEELNIDDLNLFYYLSLYKKYKNAEIDKKQVFIFDKNIPGDETTCTIAWPTAICDDELLKNLPFVHYEDLVNNIDPSKAKDAAIWIKKMQAGTGSSIKRERYLSSKLNKSLNEIKIGAKGTDLFIDGPNGELVSLAEIQILQSIFDAKNNLFGGIALSDIVSNETEESLNEVWEKPCPYYEGKTYKSIVDELPNMKIFKKSFQSYLPTIDKNGDVSFNRIAPGGHGLFGVDAIRASYIDDLRPEFKGKTLISSIGNGEDLGSSPDPVMVAWMASENIPIAMVTTTKTNIDLKGGQISLVNEDGKVYANIIEKAQAEESNQLNLFFDLGLRTNDRPAFFNTNMVLINYEVLTPIMKKLLDELGEEKLAEIITPDLIKNTKKQIENGVEKHYMQLEGAMGSVILNLDRYYRHIYNKPLVHILNVDIKNRTRFFAPIKTGFDFFMQFFSDRFSLDKNTFRLINHSPGKLPLVSLKDSYYNDVLNVLDDFKGVKLKKLTKLSIIGKINLHNINLEEVVTIENKTEQNISVSEILKEQNIDTCLKNNEIVYHSEDERPTIKTISKKTNKGE